MCALSSLLMCSCCRYSYVCPDLIKEYAKFDAKPDKYFKTYTGTKRSSGASYTAEIGYERFLGPEVFFNPGEPPLFVRVSGLCVSWSYSAFLSALLIVRWA